MLYPDQDAVPVEHQEGESKGPTEYEVKDARFRTFTTAGNWEWSDSFLAAMEQQTGWTSARSGNYSISVSYEDIFTQEIQQERLVFVHTGSEVIIRVNDTPCCCSGLITIPTGLSSPKMKDLKQLIQEEITLQVDQHQAVVIQRIKQCLSDIDAH